MRQGFRKAQLYPIPNFAYLISVMKTDSRQEAAQSMNNTEAVSAAERERLANVLQKELTEAARDIATSLRLSDTNSEIIREQYRRNQSVIRSSLRTIFVVKNKGAPFKDAPFG